MRALAGIVYELACNVGVTDSDPYESNGRDSSHG